jgi:hypothetical protein
VCSKTCKCITTSNTVEPQLLPYWHNKSPTAKLAKKGRKQFKEQELSAHHAHCMGHCYMPDAATSDHKATSDIKHIAMQIKGTPKQAITYH